MTDAAASQAQAAFGPKATRARAAPAPRAAPASSAPGVSVVHDAVPGRVRLQVEGLKGSPGYAAQLERALTRLDGVLLVRASPLTGTVLVLSDRTRELADPAPLIRSALAGEPDAGMRDGEGEHWRGLDPDDLARALGSSSTDGLDPHEARTRLRRFGANVLAAPVQRSALNLAVSQLRNVPTALLAVASVASLFTGGAVEALAILGAVVLNSAIGYTTERRAQKTIESLSRLDLPEVTVIRGGQPIGIPVEAVVPGDLLQLSRGDIAPADARLVLADRLTASEAALTGESVPVAKTTAPPPSGPVPLAERTNMVFRGSLITGGSGTALVTAAGMATEVGAIQRLAGSATPPETPSQKKLGRLGRQIAALSIGVGVLSVALGLLRGVPLFHLLRTGLSLAIAVVPEGLTTLATTTLALGVEEMRKRGVLVRSLHALETLASATVVCFDKTGTLTRNEMRVSAISCGNGLQLVSPAAAAAPAPLEMRLFRTALLASEMALDGAGDASPDASSTESALARAAAERGLDLAALGAAFPRLAVEHRSEARRYLASVHALPDGRRLAAMKGSPLEVLDLCAWEALGDGGHAPLTPARRAAIGRLNADMADRALRVLGVADREHPAEDVADDAGDAAQQLTWLGLVGMADPVREGASEVLAGLRDAGVRPIMITGDQSATAKAIAAQMRLSADREPVVMEAGALAGLAPEAIARAVYDVDVFARVSPEQKLIVLRALQQTGAVVAMVGDGINDSPALRAADVGIALGEAGSSAAQEVADVLLETDDLAGLLIALERGRAIRGNVREAVAYLLSTNGGEVAVMLGGLAIGFGEALTPMQILWINLVSDVLPGLGLALQPPDADALKRPPSADLVFLDRPEAWRRAREAAVLGAGALAACAWGVLRHGAQSPRTRTMTFFSLVTAELLHGFTCRSPSRGLFTRERPAPNPALLKALGASAALQGAVFCFPPLRRIMGVARLGFGDVCATAACGIAPFLCLEAAKAARAQPFRLEGARS